MVSHVGLGLQQSLTVQEEPVHGVLDGNLYIPGSHLSKHAQVALQVEFPSRPSLTVVAIPIYAKLIIPPINIHHNNTCKS